MKMRFHSSQLFAMRSFTEQRKYLNEMRRKIHWKSFHKEFSFFAVNNKIYAKKSRAKECVNFPSKGENL
jgi:hypothetical protein